MTDQEQSGVPFKRLESEVTCPLCLDIFTDPKRLPCDHIYCRECLRGLALRSTTASISCPECRRDNIPVPNFDVTHFPTPRQVVRLVEIYQENLRSAATPHAQPATCNIHNSEPLALYCETCEKLVYRDCVILSCSRMNHKYGFIDEMVEKYRSELNGELEPIKMLHQRLSTAIKLVSTAENEAQNRKEACLRSNESAFDALSEILEQERRHFAESIKKSFVEQESLNSAKKREISDMLTKLELLIQSTESASSNEPKPSFLEHIADKKQTIERTKNLATSLSTHAVKLPEMEVEVLSSTELKNLCHTKNFMYKKEDTLKGHVDRSLDLSNVSAHKALEMSIYLNTHSVKRSMFGNINIAAQLVCHHSRSSIKVAVKEITPEKYSLSFVPQGRGKHELHVKYNDEHISGSPIPVNVNLNPHELKRIRFFGYKRLNGVAGIKCHKDKLYVCAENVGILVLNSSTKAIERTIKVPGVWECLIDNDHIYGTDNKHSVLKMDFNGAVIKSTGTLGVFPGQFNQTNGLRLSRDNELYVCDTRNNRIQVFDRDLNLIRVFGRSGNANGCFNVLNDFDFDEAGNLYVIDNGNHRIQVLTPQGQHIRNIGRHGLNPGELKHPCSVAIHKNLLYITDRLNRRICVFTTGGEFVTTFGEGNMSLPECIAIDDYGYIYVTDDRSKIITF